MIIQDLAKTRDQITDNLILKLTYQPPVHEMLVIQHLSPAAQGALRELCPNETGPHVSPDQPEVIALRILDFLSSKQGYIRRKGHSFRSKATYLQVVPVMVKAIRQGQPIKLGSLCLCTTLANVKYAGESPYPHMAAYIAFENLHKIAKGAQEIYAPGIKLMLGYEGTLFRSLYFHNETVVRNSLAILRELNEVAYRHVIGSGPNPIEVIDAVWMVEQTFGSLDQFFEQVEDYKQFIRDESTADWREWYEKTVSDHYLPDGPHKEQFIIDKARWRAAVCHFKYYGGTLGKGFVHFDDSVISFTPSGWRTNALALQLVPKSMYLPHQRVIVYDDQADQWSMHAYQELQQDDAIYAPRYIRRYDYPFYFKKLSPS